MIRTNLNYPLEKAVAFLKGAGIDIRAHVLVVGPIAFLVCWKRDSGKRKGSD